MADHIEQPLFDQDSPFFQLHAMMLAVEWEITDTLMARLVAEIESLKKRFKTDTNLLLFLKLLGSVAGYIGNKKVAAHPDAVKLFHSAYHSFTRVAGQAGMSEAEKKKILSAEVKKFLELKNQIAGAKAQAPAPPPVPEPAAVVQAPEAVVVDAAADKTGQAKVIDEDLAFVLEEIKKIIQLEFAALRRELKATR